MAQLAPVCGAGGGSVVGNCSAVDLAAVGTDSRVVVAAAVGNRETAAGADLNRGCSRRWLEGDFRIQWDLARKRCGGRLRSCAFQTWEETGWGFHTATVVAADRHSSLVGVAGSREVAADNHPAVADSNAAASVPLPMMR